MSTCKHKKPCSCSDVALTTGTPCAQNTPECPVPNPCSETFSSDCILYTGPTLLNILENLDPIIVLPTGIPISEAMQIIFSYFFYQDINPGLMYLRTTSITSTTIGLAWNDIGGPYIVLMKLATDPTASFLPVVTGVIPSYVTITGLIANTAYDIYITGVGVSIVIRITTLS